MRCPKCQYLGFDGQERCRNCGYDFSLSQTLSPEQVAASDPMSGRGEPHGPSALGAEAEAGADLLLRPEPTARERARAAIQKRQAASRPGGEAFDLPLFAGAAEPAMPESARVEPRPPMPRPGEGRPFVSASPTPRPPLSVRRATSEPARGRGSAAFAPTSGESPGPAATEAPASSAAIEPFDVDELPMSLASAPETIAEPRDERPPREALAVAAPGDGEAAPGADVVSSRAAPIRARVIAGLIDAGILGAIDLVVIAFTLRLTAVGWNELGRLPLAPLAAFLALLATGYLTMFTVLAGQTAGKMAVGIRVVESSGGPVRFGHAVLRAAVQVATVPLLGLGFLPALLGSDRRALYDRLSETEVVRGDE
jgi:uncharacterized RDD family membrane protein YckC